MIPFARMTVNGRSRSLNAERLINLYPEATEPGAKSPLIIRSTPGLSQFSIVGVGPIRGMRLFGSLVFVVSGTILYSVDDQGTPTSRGTIAGTGDVSMTALVAQLMIVDSAGTGYVWNGSTLATIVDVDFTPAGTITNINQRIAYSEIGTGRVHVSAPNDATSYPGLAFGTAEFASDNVTEVFAHDGLLWVFGERTIEIWYDSAVSPMPLIPIAGAQRTDIGGIAGTVAATDETLYWLAQDGMVYRANGLVPARISTHAIEHFLRGKSDLRAFAYKDEGHAFYVLNTESGAVVYDASTQLWHERESFTVGRWRTDTYVRAFGKHIAGDYLLGILYEMSLENHSDGTNALQRRAISPPVHDDGNLVSMSDLQVHFEHGVGLTAGQGSDPRVILDYSVDGGQTYGNEIWGSIGKIGEYLKRAVWRRLGRFRQRNFRLTYSEPTPFTIYGAKAR